MSQDGAACYYLGTKASAVLLVPFLVDEPVCAAIARRSLLSFSDCPASAESSNAYLAFFILGPLGSSFPSQDFRLCCFSWLHKCR